MKKILFNILVLIMFPVLIFTDSHNKDDVKMKISAHYRLLQVSVLSNDMKSIKGLSSKDFKIHENEELIKITSIDEINYLDGQSDEPSKNDSEETQPDKELYNYLKPNFYIFLFAGKMNQDSDEFQNLVKAMKEFVKGIDNKRDYFGMYYADYDNTVVLTEMTDNTETFLHSIEENLESGNIDFNKFKEVTMKMNWDLLRGMTDFLLNLENLDARKILFIFSDGVPFNTSLDRVKIGNSIKYSIDQREKVKSELTFNQYLNNADCLSVVMDSNTRTMKALSGRNTYFKLNDKKRLGALMDMKGIEGSSHYFKIAKSVSELLNIFNDIYNATQHYYLITYPTVKTDKSISKVSVECSSDDAEILIYKSIYLNQTDALKD
ncbi:MAG: hypothetical protein JW737_01315 [Acidobacteria bacterium]|nr:hypothetical protein [Acidobacteriota bacterium]